MKPKVSEEKSFESKANYYATIANGTVFKASVHLEDSTDEIFWKPILNYIFPMEKFNFIYESESLFGNKTRGCEQCLKYKNYLSKQFFICIDSDYRYLLQEEGLSAENFVFQTYTHSIENHLCYKSKLNGTPENCTGLENTVFDFETFLLAYSNAIYEAFIWHLYFLMIGDDVTFSKDKFTSILQLSGMMGFSINNDGEAIINELSTRCTTKVTQLRAAYAHVDLVTEQTHFSTLGVTQDNAYLYVRGHNLFDLIVKIGKKANDILLAQQRDHLQLRGEAAVQLFANSIKFEDKLKEEIIFEGYEQIEKIRGEMIQFL